MFRCKITEFFFFLIPIKRWRGFLIRRHIQKCPSCLDKTASVEEAKLLLIQENEVDNLEGLWPAVKARLYEDKREEKFSFLRRWKWVYGAVGLLAVIVSSVWLYIAVFPDRGPSDETMTEQFRINHITIENEPARAYIFCPQGSKIIIVWAEKNI